MQKTIPIAKEHCRKKIDSRGDALVEIESSIGLAAKATEMDRVAPRPAGAHGGRSPYPTKTLVHIVVLRRLYNLFDEQIEHMLL